MAINILSLKAIKKSYGPRLVLDDVNFGIDSKAKMGLVGSNGSGKSTLVKIILGIETADSGEVHRNKSFQFGYLSQEPVFENQGTIFETVLADQKETLDLLRRFEDLSLEVSEQPSKLAQLEKLQQELESCDAWNLENEVKQSLALMGFRDINRSITELSGGEQKKVALARLFLQKPDFMLLDEPTNHLDTQTIEWLEQKLAEFEGSLLLITHDRYFLQRVTTKIAEIDNGNLRVYDGNYDRYLESKAHQTEVNQRTRHNQLRFLQREYQWMQKMPRARGTKSKSRIQTFEKTKTELSPRMVPLQEFQFGLAHRLGDRILEWNQLGQAFTSDQWLFRNSCHKMLEKERLGITGRNGSGKSTFLKVLLGDMKPLEGSVLPGSNTRFCYFDQQRIQLDPTKTVLQSFEEYGESIQTDRGQMHIKAFLERFLFNRDRLGVKIEKLSGGEKARLMLARMVANPGNLMILDEPTNDLDLDTLRFLEEALAAYPGCAIVVSHDRYFLDRVCTSIMEIGHDITPLISAGNYSFLQWIKQENKMSSNSDLLESSQSASITKNQKPRSKKQFGNKETRRLQEIEEQISTLEQNQNKLQEQLQNPVGNQEMNYAAIGNMLSTTERELENLYLEWEELENLRSES